MVHFYNSNHSSSYSWMHCTHTYRIGDHRVTRFEIVRGRVVAALNEDVRTTKMHLRWMHGTNQWTSDDRFTVKRWVIWETLVQIGSEYQAKWIGDDEDGQQNRFRHSIDRCCLRWGEEYQSAGSKKWMTILGRFQSGLWSTVHQFELNSLLQCVVLYHIYIMVSAMIDIFCFPQILRSQILRVNGSPAACCMPPSSPSPIQSNLRCIHGHMQTHRRPCALCANLKYFQYLIKYRIGVVFR